MSTRGADTERAAKGGLFCALPACCYIRECHARNMCRGGFIAAARLIGQGIDADCHGLVNLCQASDDSGSAGSAQAQIIS